MVAQAGELTPRLPAVRRPEHRRVLDAGVDRVGIGERRLEVPDPRELEGPLRAVVPEVIDLPAPEVRAAHVPVPARAVRGQDERALANADQYAYATHALLLSRLSLRRGFGQRGHAGQALVELGTERLVHVHEEKDGPADEVLVTVHTPRHGGPLALGPERELRRIGRLERLQELELDPDQLVRPALRDRHPPFTDLLVAGPREAGPLAGRGALERVLGRRVELRPR